ncbi:MAG: hypothetical protein U5P41_11195 [Gammaproteobacteria bacterium]|nr:hypothetical protein [Gammaproteobacteria bacterium]
MTAVRQRWSFTNVPLIPLIFGSIGLQPDRWLHQLERRIQVRDL